MNPHTVHHATAKAPDSGLKLGFGNPPATTGSRKSIAVLQKTPSKAPDTPGDAKSDTSSTYEFKFRSASHLSSEAQQLMDNLRDEAARIKEQMRAEKITQDEKDAEAEDHFQGFGAAGRKIAKPRGKAGRFSDIHMAEFKKMDSIANHASAFRGSSAPGFAQPTAQSLKRSPSKAGLDEPLRPQTAGKGTPVRRTPTSRLPNRRPTTVSPFKILPKLLQEASTSSPAKRQRQSELGDVSTARAQHHNEEDTSTKTIVPHSISGSGVPHSLLSPTKSSLARSSSMKAPTASSDKPSMLPRSQSNKSLQPSLPSTETPIKPVSLHSAQVTSVSPAKLTPHSMSKIPLSDSAVLSRPLPPLPTDQGIAGKQRNQFPLQEREFTTIFTSPSKTSSFASKLPTFAGLKSILRPSRPQGLQAPTSPDRASTPKRPNTANAADSAKKVDFTPSVKSRYAVKLAAESPSPAKVHQDTPRPSSARFDSTACTVHDNTADDEEWEDAEEDAEVDSEVAYPTLPPSSPAQTKSPSVQTVQAFTQKAKGVNRRESLDFKSITACGVRTLTDNHFSMTAFNTTMNKANAGVNMDMEAKSPSNGSKPSPATIRRVRPSNANEIVKPFEEPDKYLPHGLPAKKRRHETEKHGDLDDTKENQHPSFSPAKVPGSWEDSVLEEDEGDKRAGKRVRVEKSEGPAVSPQKKPNPAREAAAKAAKDRKKSGILMSRLNMLARPKGR